MTALAEGLARRRGMYPLTDETLDHLAVEGWTMERLAQALLDDIDLVQVEPRSREKDFATFSFKQDPLLWGIFGASGAALVIYPMVIGAWVYIAGIGLGGPLNRNLHILAIAAGFTLVFLVFGLGLYINGKRLLLEKVDRPSE